MGDYLPHCAHVERVPVRLEGQRGAVLVSQLSCHFCRSSIKPYLFFFFLLPLSPHLLPVSNNLPLGHSLPASDNTPTFAFLMRFIIAPHIMLSATYFTFCQALSLL